MTKIKSSNSKKESPLYENKAEAPSPFTKNRARIKIAHDGLEEGAIIVASEKNINLMIELGYWELCE